MLPTQSYINQGRGGFIIYQDQHGELKLEFEYLGGSGVAFIYFPSDKEWQAIRNRKGTDRIAVMTFIAEQAIKDKAPECTYTFMEEGIQINR